MCWNDSKKAHKTERNVSNTRTVCLGHTVILNASILPFFLFGYGWFAFPCSKPPPGDRKEVCDQLVL